MWSINLSGYLDEFLLVSAAHFLALLSPGPDFVLLVRSSLINRFRVAAGVCLGIALANGVYILLCLLSLQLVTLVAGLYDLIRYLGAAYLIYLGVQLLWSDTKGVEIAVSGGDRASESSFLRELITGFTASLLNPKISLFYLSLFTLVIDTSTPLLVQSLYGGWMFLVVLLWDLALVRFVGTSVIRSLLSAGLSKVEKTCGAVLTAAGVSLVLDR